MQNHQPAPPKDVVVIYVDVDETLLDPDKNPEPRVVDHICELHREGARLYCWSTGGEEHARGSAERLGIAPCFHGFLHKPHLFIDNEKAEEWPYFIHIAPDNLGTLEEYRQKIARRKEEREQS